MEANAEHQNQKEQVVVDRATSKLSDLWMKEDYWAIWLGLFLLLAGILIYFNNAPPEMNQKIAQANEVLASESARAPFKTVAWYQAVDAKKKLKAASSPIGKQIKYLTSKPHGWSSNPVHTLMMSEGAAAAKNEKGQAKYDAAKVKAAETLAAAQAAETAAMEAGFADETLLRPRKKPAPNPTTRFRG